MINSQNLEEIENAYLNKVSTGNFMPSVFVLEPISYCNLACVMCPNSLLNANQLGFMEIEVFTRILNKITPYSENTMLYFMGEPLQHPDIIEIIKIARKILKGKITISTNCMLLSNEISEIIIECKIDVVICCVDHWSKEKYEKIRIGGNFETVVSNIKHLLKLNQKDNDTKIIVKSLDFGFGEDERIRFENYWRASGGIPLIGWIDSWAGQFPNLRKLNYQQQPYKNIKRTACADLWFKMVINWKGEVVICCHNFDYSIKIGEVTGDRSIKEIWQSKEIVSLRESHISNSFSCNKLCLKCSEWGTLNEMYVYTSLKEDSLSLIF